MSAKALVLVTTSFPIAGDGSEAAGSFVADLAEELATRGPVRVVAPGNERETESWKNNIEVFRFPAPNKPLSTLRPWRPADLHWLVKVLREGQAATNRAVADGASQILALWGLPCGEWARRAAKRANLGYSVWLLGSDVWSLGKLPVTRAMLARVMRKAHKVWADGYKLAEDAMQIAGSQVDFLPSTRKTLTVNPPPPRDKPPYRLLFLGRWHPNKGVDLLLDALALLGDEDWQRIEKVEIQGGGPMENLVRERVAALQAAGRPIEAGRYLNKLEAEAAIMRADWLIIPSRIESIPVVFSDAMKLGRPVLCTPVGDLPGLVMHESACGLVAQSPQSTEICRLLAAALQQSARSFFAGISNRASKFELASVTHRLLQSAHDNVQKA